ncbi:hypothetical protein EON77_21850, partial [bacterium]
MRSRSVLSGLLAACALASLGPSVAGCGAEAKPAEAPENAASNETHQTPAKKRAGLSVQTELGQIDAALTERTFTALSPALSACFQAGLGRVDY